MAEDIGLHNQEEQLRRQRRELDEAPGDQE